jgi:cytochrome c oxidase subunit 2
VTTPLSYLESFGPAGDPVVRLAWGLGAVSLAVIAIISALVVGACLRRRAPAEADGQGRVPIGRDLGGVRWIYVGVGISTVVLLACTVWTLATLAAVAAPPFEPKVAVEVTANQWWWGVRYLGSDAGGTFTTANELHIPVGEPVRVRLIAGDVIHSFWVPQLAGKTDVIPGQTNVMWLQADKPGTYRGQCAEYCGVQHAHMGFVVVAQPRAAFDAWWNAQLAEAPAPASSVAQKGERVFTARCGACHTVRGTDAGGILGADLTHLRSRQTLAAGTWPNDPGRLAGWILGAQSVKPGCRMPQLTMPGQDMSALLAWLDTLK